MTGKVMRIDDIGENKLGDITYTVVVPAGWFRPTPALGI